MTKLFTMQHLLYAFAIALANNVDNIGARIAYSIGGVKIRLAINLWITAITFAISLFATLLGTRLVGALGAHLTALIAMVLLIVLGAWMIAEPYIRVEFNQRAVRSNSGKTRTAVFNRQCADTGNLKQVGFKEGTILGIALSINNIGGGLSAGMLGLNAPLVAFLSASVSFIALWAGNFLAEPFAKVKAAHWIRYMGGVMLMTIGIARFCN